MSKEEIKEYLKRIDELGNKLTGKDKETYAWLIYGYNKCAKLLNETEQQCKKQKGIIDKINSIIKGIAYGGNEDYYIEKINKINELQRKNKKSNRMS